MKGVIKTFLPEKRYGFIHAEDGKDYFFHISGFNERQHPHQLSEGSEVTFEPVDTPKGEQAQQIDLLTTVEISTYIVPDGFVAARSAKVGAWPAIERGEWWVHGSSEVSIDEAKEEAIARAKTLGANALLAIEYEKPVNAGGKGHATLHRVKGRPAVLAKKHTEGQNTLDELKGLNQNASKVKAQMDQQAQQKKRQTYLLWLVLAIIGVALWLSPIVQWAQIAATAGLGILAIFIAKKNHQQPWLERATD